MLLNEIIVRIDNFDEAERIKERKRRVLPPVYNEARLTEKPMPLLVLVEKNNDETIDSSIVDEDPLNTTSGGSLEQIDSTQISTNDDEIETNTNNNSFDAQDVNDTPVALNSGNESIIPPSNIISLDPNSEQSTTPVENNMTSLDSNNMSLNPNSSLFATNINNDNDSDANTATASTINNTVDAFTSSIIISSTSKQSVTADMLSSALNSSMAIGLPIKNEPIFDQLNEVDGHVVDNLFNENDDGGCDDEASDPTATDLSNESYENCGPDDDVMVHRSATLPKPIGERNPYLVKVNDLISGKIPFALNVSVFFVSIVLRQANN